MERCTEAVLRRSLFRGLRRALARWFAVAGAAPAAVLVLLALTTLACDSGNPVAPAPPAPNPATYDLTLTADPARVNAGSSVGSTLTLTARRLSDGQPPSNGTTASVAVDKGSFGVDGSGSPITLATVSLVDGRGQLQYLPPSDPATASVVATLDDTVERLSIQVVTPGDPPKAKFSVQTSGLQAIFTDESTGDPTGYSWSFGDGKSSTAQNPTHTYGAAGTFTATLTVTSENGTSTASNFVTVSRGAGPTAAFTSSVSGLTVAFTSTSMGDPTSYLWSFGDGDTSTAQNPVHTYDSADTYQVSLTVTNAGGSNTKTDFVTVPSGGPPTAKFSTSTSGLELLVTDESTGSPTSWSWSFGDGTTATGKAPPPHTYASAGTYTVSLTVSNEAGSDGVSQFITVSLGNPPTAEFSTTVSGLEVLVSDESTGSPTSWAWDFGDGATATGKAPAAHTYDSAGTYTITLTVTNAAGSDTTRNLVTVALAPVASFFCTASSSRLVSFTDTSTNTPTAWSWSFGDGMTSTAQDPTHSYTEDMTYTVNLTVSNAGGSSTATRVITITEGSPSACQ